MARKLFCEINPLCYEISLRKEYLKKDFKDFIRPYKFAKDINTKPLANIIKGHCSLLIRKLHGVDIELQKNKVKNIELACAKVNGIIVHPNEVFSFWHLLGRTKREYGYKDGLVIKKHGMGQAPGGGLCQLANMIHYLVLNSPLEVVELHHHGDALFPDEKRRVPFGTGTSILYKHIDYRFKNTLDQDIQILVWIENGELCGELRSEKIIPYRYKLIEENHHFEKINKDYYRKSKVYKITIDRKDNKEVAKELVLDNNSKVMYDHSLIPKEQIREEVEV